MTGPEVCFRPLLRSVFGEDALVNVSVEKQGDGKLAGFIRIRSKTQVRILLNLTLDDTPVREGSIASGKAPLC